MYEIIVGYIRLICVWVHAFCAPEVLSVLFWRKNLWRMCKVRTCCEIAILFIYHYIYHFYAMKTRKIFKMTILYSLFRSWSDNFWTFCLCTIDVAQCWSLPLVNLLIGVTEANIDKKGDYLLFSFAFVCFLFFVRKNIRRYNLPTQTSLRWPLVNKERVYKVF